MLLSPRAIPLPAVVLLLLLAFGCGGDSGGPTSPPENPVAAATLSTGRAASLERVTVLGLPLPRRAEGQAQTSYVVMLQTAGLEAIEFPLDHDSEGWFFRAPLHPATPNEGGSVEVRIRAGEHQSGPLALDIDALPDAPGAFAAVVAKMHEHLELVASLMGTTVAELKATAPEAVAPELLLLKLAQSYLDSDTDPHDLSDLAANADGFLDAEAVGILDRMFGYCELERLLQAQIDSLGALPDAGVFTWKSEGLSRRACIDIGPDIGSAPELAQAMTRSRVGEIGSDPDSDPGRILGAGGVYLAGVGTVPGAGLPAAVGAIALAGTSAVAGAFAGLLPSYFQSIESQVQPKEFDEDTTDEATWSNVWVWAASTGWSADQILANVVINLAGGALSQAEKAKILGSDLARDVAAIGLGVAANEVFADTGVIEFCPRQWRVDISSPLYCTATALNRRFDVDVQAQRAKPADVGVDQLRVAAQATQFGGRSIHQDHAMLVRQIQVVLTPDEIVVENPGQDIPVTAEIYNAEITSLRWTPEQGEWNDGVFGSDTSSGRTRTLKTPQNPDLYPFSVRVESLSRQGLRESGIPARIGYATIRTEAPRLRIDPPYDCIPPGQSLQLTAVVTGIEEYTVVWELVEGYGSITQNGLYQSLGSGSSNAVIEARLEENAEISATARVDVGACNCRFEISITGDSIWSAAGSQVAYSISEFDDLFYQFFFDIGAGDFPSISASIAGSPEQPAPRPGQTGSWRVFFTYVTESESWTSIWDHEKVLLPGVSLELTELTETAMVGRFTGNAFQLDENGEVSSVVGVDVSFRAGYFENFGSWPCE